MGLPVRIYFLNNLSIAWIQTWVHHLYGSIVSSALPGDLDEPVGEDFNKSCAN